MEEQDRTLTWREIGDIGGWVSPVFVRGHRNERAVAVSALAAEIATAQGTILWVGSQHIARPLAWLPLRERRMDARPLRTELGEAPWPGVNPFDLDSDLLAAWLCGGGTTLGTWSATKVREVIEQARSAEAGARVRRSTLPFSEGGDWLASLGLSVPRASAALRRESAARERTDLAFPQGSLTVICGHGQDMRDRAEELHLAILAFTSAARVQQEHHPRLIVLDGVWATLAGRRQAALTEALLAFTGRGDGRVLLGDDVPLDSPAVPAWEAALVHVDPGAQAGELAVVRTPGGRAARMRVPSPAGLADE